MHDRLHQFGRTQKRQFASTYYAPSSGDHFPQLGSEASAFPPPLLNQEVLLAMDFIGWHATTSRTSAKRTRLKFDAGTISPALGDCYTQTFLTARAILPHGLSYRTGYLTARAIRDACARFEHKLGLSRALDSSRHCSFSRARISMCSACQFSRRMQLDAQLGWKQSFRKRIRGTDRSKTTPIIAITADA